MGILSCIGSWGTDRNDLSHSPISGADAKIRSQILGDKLPLTVLVTILWVLQFQVSKMAGQPVSFPAAPSPTWENALAPAEGQVGEDPQQAAPMATLPANQVLQFEEVVASLQANNYSTSAQYWSDSFVLLPLGSTLLVPTNAAFNGLRNASSLSGFPSLGHLLAYHTLLQQLSYEQITVLPVGTRFITMRTDNNVIVTSAAPDDFMVDNVRIVQGNVCSSPTMPLEITCHGVDGVLNMTEWGRATLAHHVPSPSPAESDEWTILPPPPEAGSGMSPSGGARQVQRRHRTFLLVFAYVFVLLHCFARSD